MFTINVFKAFHEPLAMDASTALMIRISRRGIYSPGDTNSLVSRSFDGEVGPEIHHFGELYSTLHAGSITLRGQETLFTLYLLSELGDVALTDGEQRVLDYLFNHKGRGNVTNDACVYGDAHRQRKAKDTDHPVRWIVRPKEFNDGGEAVPGERSEEYHILLPASGYVECTNDGAYRSDTGTPFSTVPARETAEQSWTGRGFSVDFARKAVSYFYRSSNLSGTAAVDRWFYTEDYGCFNFSADLDPGSSYSSIGSFPAREAAERSEAPPGFRMVTVTEYQALQRDQQTLADIRERIRT